MFLLSKQFATARRVAEDYGFRQLSFKFQGDPVDVIVISKQGEQRIPKPVMLYCQGGGAEPVVSYDVNGYRLPFAADVFTDQYHVVIIGKPFIPVIEHTDRLLNGLYFENIADNSLPKAFSRRHHLDYYVYRNTRILKQLSSERWVRSSGLVVAGSEEGSVVACKLASCYSKVSKLIYASGNPYGPLLPLHIQNDSQEAMTDYWEGILSRRSDNGKHGEELAKSILSFSVSHKDAMIALEIPVLVSYTANDVTAPYLRLFQAETILAGKTQFAYITGRREAGENIKVRPDQCIIREDIAMEPTWEKWLLNDAVAGRNG